MIVFCKIIYQGFLVYALPKLTPLVIRSTLTSSPVSLASLIASSTMLCRPVVISRANSSIQPEPNRAGEFLSNPASIKEVALGPALPCDSSPIPPSKLTLVNLSARANMFVELSPPPPDLGTLWHARHVFASGPDMRLKFCGKSCLGLVFTIVLLLSRTISAVSGLPAPSRELNDA